MARRETLTEAMAGSPYGNDMSLPARDGGARPQLETLLEEAGRQAALAKVRGDSYAALLVAAEGVAAARRAEPVALLRVGAEFSGIAPGRSRRPW